jgi:hypothetical protein
VAVASLEDLTPDQLLAHAKTLEQSHSLLHTLTSNPETRETLQRAMKKLNPKLSIPEIDAKDAVLAVVKESSERVEKLENKIRDDEIRQRLERQRTNLMSKYRLSEEDMTAVEALMVDKDNPIPSYDAAARVYLASKQSAVPTPSAFSPPTTYEMPEKDVWGGGIANPAKLNTIAMNEAARAMQDIMGGKVAGMGPQRTN